MEIPRLGARQSWTRRVSFAGAALLTLVLMSVEAFAQAVIIQRTANCVVTVQAGAEADSKTCIVPANFTTLSENLNVSATVTRASGLTLSATQNLAVGMQLTLTGDRFQSAALAAVFTSQAAVSSNPDGVGGAGTAGQSELKIEFEISGHAHTYALKGTLQASPYSGLAPSAGEAFARIRRVSDNSYVVNKTAGGDVAQNAPASITLDESGTLIPGRYILDILVWDSATARAGQNSTSAAAANVTFSLTDKIPVLVIPGVVGTYAQDASNDQFWLTHRGVGPAALALDPLTRSYDDLMKTLTNVGYEVGKDLFPVKYDWRLPPGPIDGVTDGQVSGLTAAAISDTNYRYAVDYFGEVLKQAAERWAVDHPADPPLQEVDVIAHSTGGLVARTYIQSGAYGASYASGRSLPKIRNLILAGVPNRGASKAWNPLHDNWGTDNAFRMVLSKILDRAWKKIATGLVIQGPDYSIPGGGTCPSSPETCFIEAYVPTARALLATYDFLDDGSGISTNVNADPAFRNALLLDLNGGADANAFAAQASVTVMYATGSETPTTVVQMTGPSSGLCVAGLSFDASCPIAEFDAFGTRAAGTGETYFVDVRPANGGDGTVPIVSSASPFMGDGRVTLRPFGTIEHAGILANAEVQTAILEKLGVSFTQADISTTLNRLQGAIVSAIFDPVEGFVVDALGRRLGYSNATGPLTEIPGSVWFGNADGIGWIFRTENEPLRLPLRLQLIGLGSPYSIQVTVLADEGTGGIDVSGFLESGAQREVNIPVRTGGESEPGFTFRGFLAPVDNQPVMNAVKAGQAVPVKFSLGGNFGLDVLAATYPRVPAVACTAGLPADSIAEAISAAASSLSYDAKSDVYTYVWKTDKSWANTCRTFVMRLSDGSEHVASFVFSK